MNFNISQLKTLVFLFFVCITNNVLSQRSFYVSSSGNDANSGTSPSAAWKTISKVNDEKRNFRPGDVINFKRSEVFYGSLDLKGKSGTVSQTITIKSYGNGEKAIIRAAVPINNWANYADNIWQTSLSDINGTRIPSLFMNNTAQQIGREPNFNVQNGGYRKIGSHSGNNQSISDASSLPYENNRFAGGEIVLRTTDDNIKHETVISHSASTVNFSLSDPQAGFENLIENDFGYFFQNHVNTLDQNGEWAHDINTSVLYLYSTTDPNTIQVEIPNGETAISLNNAEFINIQDIIFEGGLDQTLNLSGASNLSIENCHFRNGNNYLALAYNIDTINFSNNILEQSNNLAVRWEGISGITFANNQITDIGMRSGMGVRSFIGYTGVRFNSRSGGNRNIIESNKINNIGYHALQYGGGNFTIRFNDISNYCYTKDDGGGIYSVGNRQDNNSVHNNIVHDTEGAIRGIPEGRGVKTGGIYIDNDSQNQLIYNNTIYNLKGWGLMVNLSSKSTLQDNTIYNCSFGIVTSTYNNSFGDGGSTAQATDNIIKRNILFTKDPTQFCARYTNQITEADFNTFLGDVDSNYYCQPFIAGEELSIRLERRENKMTLSEFVSAYPNYESNGLSAPRKFEQSIDPDTFIRFEVNNSDSSKQVDLGDINFIDAKGAMYSDSITLDPFSSIILISADGEVLSVDDIENVYSKINYFPNPAKDLITITGLETGDQIEFYDYLGKIIGKEVVLDTGIVLNVSNFQSGLYIVKIVNKGSFKLIKK